MEYKVKSINLQLLSSFLFIISIIISILLTYNEKRNILKKEPLFNDIFAKYLNLFNRIFALFIIVLILYINYNDYKNRNGSTNALIYQIYASIFSVISALIVLYVVIENFSDNINISSIENPIV